MTLPVTPPPGVGPAPDLYYEDFVPGRVFELGATTIDAEEMLAFARRFDPQWYHVDATRASASPYGGLIASGFFTVSLFMRAYVDRVLARAAADASPGLEELRWLAPAYAGDILDGRLDVIGRRPSRAKPGYGTVTLQGTLSRRGGAPDGHDDGRDRTAAVAGPGGAGGADVLRTRFRWWFAMREPAGPADG